MNALQSGSMASGNTRSFVLPVAVGGAVWPRSLWMLVMLVALVFSSALGVVWFTHQSRLATAEIARLQSAIGELDLEWNQLRIEESTLSDHARIEKIARERLGMEMPGLEGSVMIARERDDAGVAVGGLTPTAGGED